MSRFDPDCDAEEWQYALWQATVKRSLNGKRGQAMLRRLEQALLELPEKRLITGSTAEAENGQPGVCALGALGWWNLREAGWDEQRAFEEVPSHETDFETAEWASATFDVSFTMAWEIAFQNDEVCFTESPEERYEYMLKWVRARIKAEP